MPVLPENPVPMLLVLGTCPPGSTWQTVEQHFVLEWVQLRSMLSSFLFKTSPCIFEFSSIAYWCNYLQYFAFKSVPLSIDTGSPS